MNTGITTEERKEAISIAMNILKNMVIDTKTSIALKDNNIIFFGTEDYLRNGSVKGIDAFRYDINELVK